MGLSTFVSTLIGVISIVTLCITPVTKSHDPFNTVDDINPALTTIRNMP